MKCFILCLFSTFMMGCSSSNWQTAKRDSANIAPKANEIQETIFQIYYARAFTWRGYFATHPWVAWKKTEDAEYSVAQITSWGLRRGGSALSVTQEEPDRYWFGNKPYLLYEARGEKADKIIAEVQQLIDNYPYSKVYTLWPGPNSNTFVDYVIRNVHEIKVELPPHAIGKDYLVDSWFFSKSPTKTGFQFSLFGALGLTLGLADGIEVNILSMTFGVDILRPALKLPFVGRLGVSDKSL